MDNLQKLILLYRDYLDMYTAYLRGETSEENYDNFCDWFADQLTELGEGHRCL